MTLAPLRWFVRIALGIGLLLTLWHAVRPAAVLDPRNDAYSTGECP